MSTIFVVAFMSQETLFSTKKGSCVFFFVEGEMKKIHPGVQQELVYDVDARFQQEYPTNTPCLGAGIQTKTNLLLTKSASGSCKSQWNVVGPRCRLDLPPFSPRIPVAFLPASRVWGESVGGRDEKWKRKATKNHL